MLQFTGVQAGAREQRRAIVQLFSVKSMIQCRQRKGKQTYLAFIDFGKTWKNEVFYNIWKQGINHRIWRVMIELNQNRKVRMLIKYGLSDEITVQDNKGQGNVLSGHKFTSLADEIAVEASWNGSFTFYGWHHLCQ